MLWAQRLWLRLQSLFRRDRAAQRLDDEIRFHLEQQIIENIAAGMSREEARHAAMRAFGNTTVLKEETRDTWGWIWLDQGGQDLGFGLRTLRNSPNFPAVITQRCRCPCFRSSLVAKRCSLGRLPGGAISSSMWRWTARLRERTSGGLTTIFILNWARFRKLVGSSILRMKI